MNTYAMKLLPERVLWGVYPHLMPLLWQLRHGTEHGWILGRHACLGCDVAKRLGIGERIYNIQKGRADLLMDIVDGHTPAPRTHRVAAHMARQDIIPLIAQQQSRQWLRWMPPELIYMDSFAELVDQRFTHRRRNWSFCAYYSDIRHDEAFEQGFRTDGLLPVEHLEAAYARYFTFLRHRYGAVPIVFLHFPAALDTRDKFHERYAAIIAAIEAVSRRFPPFHAIEVDSGVVGWPEQAQIDQERFPYHFNPQTYDGFCRRLMELDVVQRLDAPRDRWASVQS